MTPSPFLSPPSEPQGICYVQTSNLDGETNLKIRQAHPATEGRKDERYLAAIEVVCVSVCVSEGEREEGRREGGSE